MTVGVFQPVRVTAYQNGKAIFVLLLPFQIQQEALNQHFICCSAAPEDLISDADLLNSTDDVSDRIKMYLLARHPFAFEFRPEKDFPQNSTWRKTGMFGLSLKRKLNSMLNNSKSFWPMP